MNKRQQPFIQAPGAEGLRALPKTNAVIRSQPLQTPCVANATRKTNGTTTMNKPLFTAMTLIATTAMLTHADLLDNLQQAGDNETTDTPAPAVETVTEKPAATPAKPAQIVAADDAKEPGAERTAWVLKQYSDRMPVEKQQGAKNEYGIDNKEAFKAGNCTTTGWNAILICWEGYIDVNSAGDYTIRAESDQAGCIVELNDKPVLKYDLSNFSNTKDKTKDSKDVTLTKGYHKIKVWMLARKPNQTLSVTYQKEKSTKVTAITPETMFHDSPDPDED